MTALALVNLALLFMLGSSFTLPSTREVHQSALHFRGEENKSRQLELPNIAPSTASNPLTGFFVKVKEMQKAFDDEVWDLFQGAKERKVRLSTVISPRQPACALTGLTPCMTGSDPLSLFPRAYIITHTVEPRPAAQV